MKKLALHSASQAKLLNHYLHAGLLYSCSRKKIIRCTQAILIRNKYHLSLYGTNRLAEMGMCKDDHQLYINSFQKKEAFQQSHTLVSSAFGVNILPVPLVTLPSGNSVRRQT